jgi:signal peptidase I
MGKIKRRNPFGAFVLTFMCCGLGQLYNGQIKKGVLFYVSMLLLEAFLVVGLLKSFYGLVTFLILALFLFIWVSIDSTTNAMKLKDYQIRPFNRWYIYITLILLTSFINNNVFQTFNPFKTYFMRGLSMFPNIQEGEHIVVNSDFYKSNIPKRGDIIIFSTKGEPEKSYNKRIIALEGELVEIQGSKILINGKVMPRNWDMRFETNRNESGKIFTYKVPKNSVFVLGDNFAHSRDSREFGAIDKKSIKAKVLYIYWSKDLKKIGKEF